jgi:hypothetical protein
VFQKHPQYMGNLQWNWGSHRVTREATVQKRLERTLSFHLRLWCRLSEAYENIKVATMEPICRDWERWGFCFLGFVYLGVLFCQVQGCFALFWMTVSCWPQPCSPPPSTQAGLNLAVLLPQPRLASNLQSSSLNLPNAGIIAVYHHTGPVLFFEGGRNIYFILAHFIFLIPKLQENLWRKRNFSDHTW